MAKLLENFAWGALSASVATGDTILNSPEFSKLPVVGGGDTLTLVLDPDESSGIPEIVYVTAHTSGATSVTVTRAREGTTARSFASSVKWVHTLTKEDIVLSSKGNFTGDVDIESENVALSVKRFGVDSSGRVQLGLNRDLTFSLRNPDGSSRVAYRLRFDEEDIRLQGNVEVDDNLNVSNNVTVGNKLTFNSYDEERANSSASTVNVDFEAQQLLRISGGGTKTINWVNNATTVPTVRSVTLVFASASAVNWPSNTRFPNGEPPELDGETWFSCVSWSLNDNGVTVFPVATGVA